MVKSLVDFERRWRESVRPGDVGSPLILPECSFETKGVLRTTWIRAFDARERQDQIDRVAKLIDYFRSTYYLKGKGRWIDAEKKAFDYRGRRHAFREPEGRRWKYTFEVPTGFHFDVESERGGKFYLTDATGAYRVFEEHANVDCHGYVRDAGSK